MAGGIEILVTSNDLRALYLRLHEIAPELRVALRHGVVAAGHDTAEAVKREASWSTRIPAAVSVKASFAAKTVGLRITVDKTKAPEARPLEHGGRDGSFRHPVFADASETRDQWTWVDQPAHPFFAKAIASEDVNYERQLFEVATEVARLAGFK
ncbi:MAG: hypothetical protein ACRDLR_09820 [Gaiellaceae bacterium]